MNMAIRASLESLRPLWRCSCPHVLSAVALSDAGEYCETGKANAKRFSQTAHARQNPCSGGNIAAQIHLREGGRQSGACDDQETKNLGRRPHLGGGTRFIPRDQASQFADQGFQAGADAQSR